MAWRRSGVGHALHLSKKKVVVYRRGTEVLGMRCNCPQSHTEVCHS